jgi:hypothetical protein
MLSSRTIDMSQINGNVTERREKGCLNIQRAFSRNESCFAGFLLVCRQFIIHSHSSIIRVVCIAYSNVFCRSAS